MLAGVVFKEPLPAAICDRRTGRPAAGAWFGGDRGVRLAPTAGAWGDLGLAVSIGGLEAECPTLFGEAPLDVVEAAAAGAGGFHPCLGLVAGFACTGISPFYKTLHIIAPSLAVTSHRLF